MGLLSLPGGGAGRTLSRLSPGGFPMSRRRPVSGPSVDSRWVFEQEIGSSAKLVLLALNVHGWPCYPTIGKLAKMTRLGRRTVQTAIGCMRTDGLLTIKCDGKSNTYHLNVPESVRRCGAGGRSSGAGGARQRRRGGAAAARGSEAFIEASKEAGVRWLAEPPATPAVADPAGTEYQSLAEALRARRQGGEAPEASRDPLSILDALRVAHGAGVPPLASGGGPAGGFETSRAQARVADLRRGRLYA